MLIIRAIWWAWVALVLAATAGAGAFAIGVGRAPDPYLDILALAAIIGALLLAVRRLLHILTVERLST